MTRAELAEAVGVMRRGLSALLAAPRALTGSQGAALRQAAGGLSDDAEAAIEAGSIGAALANCFNLAVALGPTAVAMDGVRAEALTPAAAWTSGIIVAQTFVYLSLAAQAQIVAASTITSRQDADAELDRLNAAFQAAEEGASDDADMPVYQALVALHAAVVRDLTTRSAPLPRIVTFSVPRSMTSLALAQYLYADPSRADELVAMNKVAHPLFMPLTGVALSA